MARVWILLVLSLSAAATASPWFFNKKGGMGGGRGMMRYRSGRSGGGMMTRQGNGFGAIIGKFIL